MTAPISKDQEFISRLTGIIQSNLGNEKFGVDKLARESDMSLYRLSRKLYSINKKTVNQFIREVRLNKALEMLQEGEFTASEVAFRTGFSSPAYFTKRFHEYFGYPPGRVKNGYQDDRDNINLKKPAGEFETGRSSKRTFVRSFPGVLLLTLLLAGTAYVIFDRIHKSGPDDSLISSDGRISIAVMPFQNMTNDTLWDIWQQGIQTNLITSLSNSEELKVRQIETINNLLHSKGFTNYSSISPSAAGSISQKLDAIVFILGSINQAGGILRINAQLINSKTEEPVKSFQIDGRSDNILHILDSLSAMINSTLIISRLENKRPDALPSKHFVPTNSPEAYRYFILGQNAFYKNDFLTAIKYYLQALAIDSSLVAAMSNISIAYYNDLKYDQARDWCLRSYAKYDLMSAKDKIKNDALYAIFFKTLNERIRYLRQLGEFDDQNPMTYFNIGDCYYEMFEYDKAITEFEKALGLFYKWKIKPYWGAFYYELGISYHKTGQYKKEKKLYKRADKDFPGDPGLMEQYAWLDLALGDTAAANRHLNDLISVRREESWPEARINSYLAYVYSIADMPDKEEEYHRKALSLEPDNPARMNYLAYFLIDKERNIDEGMDLVNKALKSNPDRYSYLHTRGWGLYKLGTYKEALELLERSWTLRPLYSHRIYLHLEEVKKAAARQL